MAVPALKSSTKRHCPTSSSSSKSSSSSGSPPRTPLRESASYLSATSSSANRASAIHPHRHARSQSVTDLTAKNTASPNRTFYNSQQHHHHHLPLRSTRFLHRQLSEGRLGKRIREDGSETDKESCGSQTSTPCISPIQLSPTKHHFEGKKSLQRHAGSNKTPDMDNSEIQAEEKIIRAVQAQGKSMQSDLLDLREQLTSSDLSSMMCAEVWQAVINLENDPAEISSGKIVWPTGSIKPADGDDASQISVYEGLLEALTETCKNYAEKLDESEKTMQGLRSDLAEAQQQCLEMAKVLMELLPSMPSLSNASMSSEQNLFQQTITKENEVPMILLEQSGLKRDTEIVIPMEIPEDVCKDELIETEFLQKVCSESELEAAAFSHSRNVGNVSEDPIKRRSWRKWKTDENSNALKASEIVSKPDCPLSRDGIFLPWLQFVEADVGFSFEAGNCRDKSKKQEACCSIKKITHSGGKKVSIRSTGYNTLRAVRKQPCHNNKKSGNSCATPGTVSFLSLHQRYKSLKEDWPNWKQKFVESSFGNGKNNEGRPMSSTTPTLLLNKETLKVRIKSGELLLCPGTLGLDVV